MYGQIVLAKTKFTYLRANFKFSPLLAIGKPQTDIIKKAKRSINLSFERFVHVFIKTSISTGKIHREGKPAGSFTGVIILLILRAENRHKPIFQTFQLRQPKTIFFFNQKECFSEIRKHSIFFECLTTLNRKTLATKSIPPMINLKYSVFFFFFLAGDCF